MGGRIGRDGGRRSVEVAASRSRSGPGRTELTSQFASDLSDRFSADGSTAPFSPGNVNAVPGPAPHQPARSQWESVEIRIAGGVRQRPHAALQVQDGAAVHVEQSDARIRCANVGRKNISIASGCKSAYAEP